MTLDQHLEDLLRHCREPLGYTSSGLFIILKTLRQGRSWTEAPDWAQDRLRFHAKFYCNRARQLGYYPQPATRLLENILEIWESRLRFSQALKGGSDAT